jgi:hypothetical protein
MTEFKDSKTALVAEVDCTAGGKDLCSDQGVRGKHGDPNNLEDYKAGRDYDSFKKFAEENLGPTCGLSNLDLCDDAKKAEIEKFSKMSLSDWRPLSKKRQMPWRSRKQTSRSLSRACRNDIQMQTNKRKKM